MGSFVHNMRERRIPQAFTALLAAAIPFMPRTAAAQKAEAREALADALDAAWLDNERKPWPEAAWRLVVASQAVAMLEQPAVPCGVIGDATAADWPPAVHVVQAWQRRADIGDGEPVTEADIPW
jgi:hypothetical protein